MSSSFNSPAHAIRCLRVAGFVYPVREVLAVAALALPAWANEDTWILDSDVSWRPVLPALNYLERQRWQVAAHGLSWLDPVGPDGIRSRHRAYLIKPPS